MKRLFLAVLLASLTPAPFLAFANAAQQERPFQATFAGIHTNKDDFNFTGAEKETGGFGVVTGKSTLGNFMGYVVTSSLKLDKECQGKDGAKGVEVINTEEDFVLTFDDTGDQLFLKHTSTSPGYVCTVPGGSTGNWFGFDVVGGTGRFEGATGYIRKPYNFIGLAIPASPGKGWFRSFTGTFEGSIKLAGQNAWPF